MARHIKTKSHLLNMHRTMVTPQTHQEIQEEIAKQAQGCKQPKRTSPTKKQKHIEN
jgi:hypothetical protein